MDAADLVILADELQADPEGVGYAAYTGVRGAAAYQALEVLLNTPPATAAPASCRRVPFQSLSEWAADEEVYSALLTYIRGNPGTPGADKAQAIYEQLGAPGGRSIAPVTAASLISTMTGAGVITAQQATAATALLQPLSRAEHLFGEGVEVAEIDVAAALWGDGR